MKLDSLRSPDKYRKEVFARDKYTCQYCGNKVVSKELLSAYSKVVGKENFTAVGTTNQSRHGIVLGFRANADHIDPWTRGGKTSLENLVACCWSCNYGKSSYTLEELGINSPRDNLKTNNDWNGLIEYIPLLKKI